jgi:Flavin containing amine oxidoreductase
VSRDGGNGQVRPPDARWDRAGSGHCGAGAIATAHFDSQRQAVLAVASGRYHPPATRAAVGWGLAVFIRDGRLPKPHAADGSHRRIEPDAAQDGARTTVELFEATNRLGGRIETTEILGFRAEFGAMRFEQEFQGRFFDLCKDLGVKLVQFLGPTSPAPPAASLMDLPKHECLVI